MSTSRPNNPPVVLPSRGRATVKSVLSGDTVVLFGKPATPNEKAPEVIFTFERVTAPRMASKGNNNTDDPGAFPSREWLRRTCVGKSVQFETRKQGATAGDRVYGLLFLTVDDQQLNLAVESVRSGHAIPKVVGDPNEAQDDNDAEVNDPFQYEKHLQTAYAEAKANAVGVHIPTPFVRKLLNASEDFETLALIQATQKEKVKIIMEYIFDGSRFRCFILDDRFKDFVHGSFTMLLAGVVCPRLTKEGNDMLAEQAKYFVEQRLLHRELEVTLHGTDKSGVCAVGTVHHPRGNIGIELLKNGLGKICDWSARLMNIHDVPAFRIAENEAKKSRKGIWHSYIPPRISGASEIQGVVVEIASGDTLVILPAGVNYDDESSLKKITLASVRAPRVGNEKLGKPDEPYAWECKDRLRRLTIGKQAKVTIHYERDIPMGLDKSVTRQFGSVSVPKHKDIAEVLVAEGLAETQRHRDDDERSPRYDDLVAAELAAKEAKKNIHAGKEYGKRTVNDLTEPRKAKSYSGALVRAGMLKAVVDYVFNGSRMKLYVPSENCYIAFAMEYLRCPQPSPLPGHTTAKQAEPFGDNSKRHTRLTLLQRTIEIDCKGVTQGGVITGIAYITTGNQPRQDHSLELLGAGFASIDARQLEYGKVPKQHIDAQNAAKKNRVGIWSVEQSKEPTAQFNKPITKSKEILTTITFSEIRSGKHFFYQVANDDALQAIEDSMSEFTKNKGIQPAPCDCRPGKVIAALFDDGTGKKWYRAKVLEKKSTNKISVLFLDYGNVSTIDVKKHATPLDHSSLQIDRIPAVAKEGILAFIRVPSLEEDYGVEAARELQHLAWGKKLTARIHCAIEGKNYMTLYDPEDPSGTSINSHLVASGMGRTSKKQDLDVMISRMVDTNKALEFLADLTVKQEEAKKGRNGMWRYGDVGEDDEEF